MTTSRLPINELAARYALSNAIIESLASAHDTMLNHFARFSDDDLDYFPAATNIAARCSAYIEPILIPADNSTECIDAIAELTSDDDFKLDMQTMPTTFLELYMPDDPEFDAPADSLQRDMMLTAYHTAILALPDDAQFPHDLPADFDDNLNAELTNIKNAFINAHREIYPYSFSNDTPPMPSTITLDPNPYIK